MAHPDPSDQNGGADAPPGDELPRAAATGTQLLSAHEAADFLQVSLATLHTWEREFGFPASLASEHVARGYLIRELLALQDALPEALSVRSAIQTARCQGVHTPLDAHSPVDTTASQLGSAGDGHGTPSGWRDRA